MDDPKQFSSDELAAWLKYYRALGFTHLHARGVSPLQSVEERAPIELVAAAQEGLAREQPAAGLPAEASRGETSLPMPEPLPANSAEEGALMAPSVSQGGDLFTSVAPRESLKKIQEDLGDCRRCKLWNGRKTIVFGSGSPKAELLFVGEGPGADEDEQGLPFVGRAGQLLTQMIEKGLKIPRPDVYICNIVKCRPPGNRKPERDEIAACRQFVERQIDSVRPRVIVALGATAVETLLGTKKSMASQRGRWHEFHGYPLMVTYHPAFLLRDPNRKPESWEDLKKVIALLNSPAGSRPSPGGASG